MVGVYHRGMDILLALWSKFIYTLCYFPPMQRLGLMQLVQPRYLIGPPHKTTRRKYSSERNLYRLIHSFAKQELPVSKYNYYTYKTIANKYGWPYIREVYDDKPDWVFPPAPSPSDTASEDTIDLQPIIDVVRAIGFTRSWLLLGLAISMLTVANLWIQDVPILQKPGEALLAGLGVTILMMSLFYVPILVIKLLRRAMRLAMRLIS